MKRGILYISIGALLALSGCGDNPLNAGPGGTLSTFSFEKDMEGWKANGTDLEMGGKVVDWSVARSQDMARGGSASVKLYVDNRTDAAKIWMEKPLAVKPNRTYLVTVEYDFASADYGSFNLFQIITGVLPKPPLAGGLPEPPLAQGDGKDASTLDPSVFQGDTGNGQDADVGYRWMSKKYEFTARSGMDGTLHVLVGVWGTWESPRTYYLDNLRMTLAEK